MTPMQSRQASSSFTGLDNAGYTNRTIIHLYGVDHPGNSGDPAAASGRNGRLFQFAIIRLFERLGFSPHFRRGLRSRLCKIKTIFPSRSR
jgi:hypothetical protein